MGLTVLVGLWRTFLRLWERMLPLLLVLVVVDVVCVDSGSE